MRRHTSTSTGAGFPRYANAGLIRVIGGTRDVELTFGPGGYRAFNEMLALFSGGETLTFSAIGAMIGGFEATVTAPAHVQMTAPVVPLGSDLVIDRSRDFEIVWNGTSPGSVVLRLQGPQERTRVFVSCAFPATAGRGVVPAAVLARIEPTGRGTASAEVVSETTATVPGWGPVRISATAAVLGRGRWLTPVEFR